MTSYISNLALLSSTKYQTLHVWLKCLFTGSVILRLTMRLKYSKLKDWPQETFPLFKKDWWLENPFYNLPGEVASKISALQLFDSSAFLFFCFCLPLRSLWWSWWWSLNLVYMFKLTEVDDYERRWCCCHVTDKVNQLLLVLGVSDCLHFLKFKVEISSLYQFHSFTPQWLSKLRQM